MPMSDEQKEIVGAALRAHVETLAARKALLAKARPLTPADIDAQIAKAKAVYEKSIGPWPTTVAKETQ